MYAVAKIVIFVVMSIVITSTPGFSEDFDIGQIIEISQDSSHIQVQDEIYKVGPVELLFQEGNPVAGTHQDLSEGSIVKVIRGTREVDYWNSTLVTVYLGEMEVMMREKLELPEDEEKELPEKTKTRSRPALNQAITLEDGVWSN